MRVGIDASALLRPVQGGVEIYTAELARRLPCLDPSIDFTLFFNFTHGRHRASVEKYRLAGLKTATLRVPPQLIDFASWRLGIAADPLLPKLDVFFSPSPAGPAVRHMKQVVTVHDLIPISHPEFCEPGPSRVFAHRLPAMVATAQRVIAVSEYTKSILVERLGACETRIRCVANGVHEGFRPPEDLPAARSVAARYGIEGPYFLFVGTLEPRKNLVRLVEAFGRAARGAVRDHALVLAGKPAWAGTELAAAIGGLAPGVRVLTAGHAAVGDLPALYGAATAFLFPSLAEGFGIPPIEAMACGCPVLVSTAGALPEVVGDAAMIVDPLDIDAIADAIGSLAENAALRVELREKGLHRAALFSWDRTAAETLAVMREAADANRL